MKVDKGDVTGFILGIITSVVANWMWDIYRDRQRKLQYGDKKIIEEVKSEIQGLKDHIQNNLG
jgi:hypothetical protein